jgi:hypothetical protein
MTSVLLAGDTRKCRSQIGGNMVAQATAEASKKADEPRKADELGAGRGHDAADLAPPLAPTGAQLFGDTDGSHERTLGPIKRSEQSSPVPHGETSGAQPKLIAGTAIGAALLVCAFAYFFWSSKNENTASQTAQSAPTVPTPAPAAPALVPASPSPDSTSTPSATSPSPRSTQTAVPSAASSQAPSAPPSARSPSAPSQTALPAAPTRQGPSAATPSPNQPNAVRAPATANTAMPETAPQNRNVLFSQPTGLNVRSLPSTNGTILGTAPKGIRFEITNRQGNWVEVEGGGLKGWVNSRLLAPNEPR